MKLLRPNEFALINTDIFEAEEGIKRGQRVYIAGHKALPISREDPYTQRVKFFVHLVDNGQVVLGPLYVMDPKSLKSLGANEEKKLQANLKKAVEDGNS